MSCPMSCRAVGVSDHLQNEVYLAMLVGTLGAKMFAWIEAKSFLYSFMHLP